MSLLSDRKLSDDLLDNVTGGTQIVSENTKCPICKNGVTYSRSVKYNGLNVSLYKCPKCNREFSQSQINELENLKIDYTTVRPLETACC